MSVREVRLPDGRIVKLGYNRTPAGPLCPTCSGHGFVENPDPHGPLVLCPACQGRGIAPLPERSS